jgi:pimeloyl-ACP methyl ester carboxylesterase
VACLVTVQQARHATFDAIGLLGWSAIAMGFPLPDPDDERAESVLAAGQLAIDGSEAEFAPPWRDNRVPQCVVTMFRPRIVSADASAITVPVLLASGERDAVSDPWAEPGAYRSSKLVTVCVIEGMAQMHNFAAARTELWDRISDFAHIVRPRVLRPRRVLTDWTQQRATSTGW